MKDELIGQSGGLLKQWEESLTVTLGYQLDGLCGLSDAFPLSCFTIFFDVSQGFTFPRNYLSIFLALLI